MSMLIFYIILYGWSSAFLCSGSGSWNLFKGSDPGFLKNNFQERVRGFRKIKISLRNEKRSISLHFERSSEKPNPFFRSVSLVALHNFCLVSISLRIFRLSELPDAEACLVGAGDGGDKHEVDVGHVAAAHRVYELLHRRYLVESQISVQQWNGQLHGGKIKVNEGSNTFRFFQIISRRNHTKTPK